LSLQNKLSEASGACFWKVRLAPMKAGWRTRKESFNVNINLQGY